MLASQQKQKFGFIIHAGDIRSNFLKERRLLGVRLADAQCRLHQLREREAEDLGPMGSACSAAGRPGALDGESG